jgi:hypothetical protein
MSGNDEDLVPALVQQQIGFRCRGAVRAFGEDAALKLVGILLRDDAIDCRRHENVALHCEQLVRIDTVVLHEAAQCPLLRDVLISRFYVDPFLAVDGARVIANTHNLHAHLQREREGRDRAHVSEALDNRGALLRRHLQHLHRALDEINDPAARRFTPSFGAAD